MKAPVKQSSRKGKKLYSPSLYHVVFPPLSIQVKWPLKQGLYFFFWYLFVLFICFHVGGCFLLL